ncbi:DUF4160 domain-containing protein [Selenomonas ruminantium]|uniref:DUF4160 domain-containing protein n=1 Tax=Selenomonas ruminantium TaxID=971 RepID=UPI0015697D09|nr:DUF4160 domain-containing protein [Selenomonas ruminantium]
MISLPTWGEILGYRIYFWSNEKNEPVHVHICQGVPTANATKVWIPPNGNPVVAHNDSRIPQKDLNRLLKAIAANKESIVFGWYQYFGMK